MNDAVKKIFLVGVNFMHKWPRFAYSSCGQFTKSKEKMKKENGNW